MRKAQTRGVGRIIAISGMLASAAPALGLDFAFPGPTELTATRTEPMTSLRLPIGPFSAGDLPTQVVQGALNMAAYKVTLPRASTLDLMQVLQDQLVAAGFDVLFECETEICGGYDFRYGTQVLPEPDMHVDLADFRYLAASGPGGHLVALLVSRAGNIGFVQVTEVGGTKGVVGTGTLQPPKQTAPQTNAQLAPLTAETGPAPAPATDLAGALETGRAQALEDLVFPSGSSSLLKGSYASLDGLAVWLKADPTRKVVLVGHTDASGGLESNIRLSKLRAESVRQTLLSLHNIASDRVQAEGVGPLSPRDTNLTETGRRNNRRVEVMVTSTQLLAP